MSSRKGRIFAPAVMAAVACAMLSAPPAGGQCKGKQGGPALSTQAPAALTAQQYSTLVQKQISTMTQTQLKALIKLQERQMRALQRIQQQPGAVDALGRIQQQNDLATTALLDLQAKKQQREDAKQERALKAAAN